jgi:hypothetical protein
MTYYITCYITCYINCNKKHVLGLVAINAKISAARAGEPLHGVPYVKDQSDKLIEVNLAAYYQWYYITCYIQQLLMVL